MYFRCLIDQLSHGHRVPRGPKKSGKQRESGTGKFPSRREGPDGKEITSGAGMRKKKHRIKRGGIRIRIERTVSRVR